MLIGKINVDNGDSAGLNFDLKAAVSLVFAVIVVVQLSACAFDESGWQHGEWCNRFGAKYFTMRFYERSCVVNIARVVDVEPVSAVRGFEDSGRLVNFKEKRV